MTTAQTTFRELFAMTGCDPPRPSVLSLYSLPLPFPSFPFPLMKNQNSSRVSFIRARAIALRVVSFATAAAPAAVSTAAPAPAPSALSSPANLPPVKSAHVWRKTGTAQDDASEALPSGFVPPPVSPFVPAISPEMDREVAPLAYAEALPEIGAHNLHHSVNCMLIALPWRG